MNIILNIDDQRFSLNGIKYFKNFMGHVVGENLRIVNAYDSKFQLLAWNKFDEFTVDGNTFANVSLLQDALLPVLYSRDSLGGEGGGGSVPSTTPAEQLIYFGSGAVALTAGANTQATEVAQHINNIGFAITPGVSVMFSTTIKRTINGQAKLVEKRWRFKKNNLEGTHGTGSTHGAIVYTDLIENGYERVLTAIGANDVYINLGNIGSSTIEDFINAVDPATVSWENLADDGTEYYFECVLNNDSQIYKYVGDLPVTLGTGGDVVAAIDFDLISSSGTDTSVTPTPGVEEIYFGAGVINTTAGATTTGAEIAAHINGLGFTISAGVLAVLIIDVKKTIGGTPQVVQDRYLFRNNNSPGTHGTGSINGAISYENLVFINEKVITEIHENDLYIDLGDIGNEPIEDYIDAFADDFPELVANELADDGTTYYFSCTKGTEGQIYEYVGALPVTLGFGNDDTVTADYDLIASTGSGGGGIDLSGYLLVTAFKGENLISSGLVNLTASGVVNVDFTTKVYAYLNFTATGSVTVTPPTLTNVGDTVTRMIKLIPNSNAVGLPTSITDELADDIDIAMENILVLTYCRIDGSTIDLVATLTYR